MFLWYGKGDWFDSCVSLNFLGFFFVILVMSLSVNMVSGFYKLESLFILIILFSFINLYFIMVY